MTAPDVRTAAQAEADKLYPLLTEVGVPAISKSRRLRQKAFIKGAVWGAALVTPTREQIAEALWGFPVNVITLTRLKELAQQGEGDYSETKDYLYVQADAVLALMAGSVEGGAPDRN